MTPNWFVAWPVNGAEEWIAALEAGAPGGLNFLAPADLHVTLAFLGRHDPGQLAKMSALLKSFPLREVEATLSQFTAFPQPRRFSALAFVLGQGRVDVEAQIAKWHDRICREAGAKIDVRPSLPHVTVARPDRRIGESDRNEALEWMRQLSPQTHIALRLERPRLYTWADRGSSARYQMLD